MCLGWGVEGLVVSPTCGWSLLTTHRRVVMAYAQDEACICEITNLHGCLSVSCMRSRGCVSCPDLQTRRVWACVFVACSVSSWLIGDLSLFLGGPSFVLATPASFKLLDRLAH